MKKQRKDFINLVYGLYRKSAKLNLSVSMGGFDRQTVALELLEIKRYIHEIDILLNTE